MTDIHHPINFALLGPGKVAHTHAQAVARIPGARLVAVWGRHRERTAAFAAQYSAQPFTDLAECLRDGGAQAVIVCTPHPQHAEEAIAAAEAGLHVLVEKPMALTTVDCDRMVAAAQAAGVTLGVVSQRRLYAPVLRVKQAIAAGKIGAPILATVTVLGWRGPEYYAMDPWRGTWDGEGGGILVNQVVHQLDLFQWFMGPIAEVTGYWANLNHPFIEVEDTAVAAVRFAGGALGTITVSNSQNPGLYARIHVHGANGATVGVQTDGGSVFFAGQAGKAEPPINDVWTVPGEEALLPQWQAEDRASGDTMDPLTHYHYLQIRDFVEAVQMGRDPLVPGPEGRKVVDLIEALYRAGRRGSSV